MSSNNDVGIWSMSFDEDRLVAPSLRVELLHEAFHPVPPPMAAAQNRDAVPARGQILRDRNHRRSLAAPADRKVADRDHRPGKPVRLQQAAPVQRSSSAVDSA